MPACASKSRTSSGTEDAGSPVRSRETVSSRRGPSQNGCSMARTGSRTQATMPCKLNPSSKSGWAWSSSGTAPAGKNEHSGLRNNSWAGSCRQLCRLRKCCGTKCSGNSSSRQWNWCGSIVAVCRCRDAAPIRPAIHSSHAVSFTGAAIRLPWTDCRRKSATGNAREWFRAMSSTGKIRSGSVAAQWSGSRPCWGAGWPSSLNRAAATLRPRTGLARDGKSTRTSSAGMQSLLAAPGNGCH